MFSDISKYASIVTDEYENDGFIGRTMELLIRYNMGHNVQIPAAIIQKIPRIIKIIHYIHKYKKLRRRHTEDESEVTNDTCQLYARLVIEIAIRRKIIPTEFLEGTRSNYLAIKGFSGSDWQRTVNFYASCLSSFLDDIGFLPPNATASSAPSRWWPFGP
jgi:hypothetical protein